MNKNALLVCVLAMLAFMATGCDDTTTDPPVVELASCSDYADNQPLVTGENTLLSTSWMSIGFCNAETDELEPTVRKDCDHCYRFTFGDAISDANGEWNYHFSGGTAKNAISGTCIVDYTRSAIACEETLSTLLGEPDYGKKWRLNLYSAEQFELRDNSLKLINANSGSYLLFQRRNDEK